MGCRALRWPTSWAVPVDFIPGLLLVLGVTWLLLDLPLTIVAALLIGVCVLLLILIRPRYGLYLLAFAVPFGSIWEISVGALSIGATEVLVVATLGAWLIRLMAIPNERKRSFGLHLAFPLGLLASLILISVPGAFSYSASLREVLRWMEFVGLYLFVASYLRSNDVISFVGLTVLAGCAQAAVGIYQTVQGIGPEGFLLFGRFIRSYGTFEQPNPFAGYLGLVIPMGYAFLVTRGHRLWSKGWRGRGYWLLAALGSAVMGVGLLASWSRGAWLGFAGAFLVMSISVNRRAPLLFLMICLVVLFVLLLGAFDALPSVIVERLTDFASYWGVWDVRGIEVTPQNYAILERVAHWQAAWGMFEASPWLGVGIGNYSATYSQYALPGWGDSLGHAHNFYLNILAEAGLVGLVGYLFFWGSCLWAAWRTLRMTRGINQTLTLGILGVIVAFSIHNVFDNLYVHGMNLHIAALVGSLEVLRYNLKDKSSSDCIGTPGSEMKHSVGFDAISIERARSVVND
jgi:O-antigen ligase